LIHYLALYHSFWVTLTSPIRGAPSPLQPSYTGSTHRELLDPGAVLLPKPLTRAVQLRKVRDALIFG
jgi:hypothetical protein